MWWWMCCGRVHCYSMGGLEYAEKLGVGSGGLIARRYGLAGSRTCAGCAVLCCAVLGSCLVLSGVLR